MIRLDDTLKGSKFHVNRKINYGEGYGVHVKPSESDKTQKIPGEES